MVDKINKQGASVNSLAGRPMYAFLMQNEYKPLWDIFGDICLEDIVGEGQNGIVFRHPRDPNIVLKVARSKDSDDLLKEYQVHDKFYSGLERLKTKYAGTAEGDILAQYKIPKMVRIDDEGRILQIERVQGHAFYTLALTKYHLQENPDKVHEMFPNDIEHLSDFEVLKSFRDNKLAAPSELITGSDDEMRSLVAGNLNDEKMPYLSKHFPHTRWLDIKKFLDIMRSEGYDHNDTHWGNLMRSLIHSENGSTYLIDFGRSQINDNT